MTERAVAADVAAGRGIEQRVGDLNREAKEFERTELATVIHEFGQLAANHVKSAGSARTGYKAIDGHAAQGQLEALMGDVDLMTSVRLLKGAKERGYQDSMTEEHKLPWRARQRMTEGWLFDPLDGTWEHKNNVPGYGILGGFLKRGDSGRLNPTHGIVAVPQPDGQHELFYNTIEYSAHGDSIFATHQAHYLRGGTEHELPHIRTIDEIKASGVLRVHMRGLFADMYDHPDKAHGVKHDVQHVAVAREYAQRLADKLGVRYEEVHAGGSGSGAAQLLGGRVDLVITLGRNEMNDRGDAASEWDVVGTIPNVMARGGWVAQANGSDMSTRGFMQKEPRLELGWIASVALPRDLVFDRELKPESLSGASRLEIPESKRIAAESLLGEHGQEHLVPHLTPPLAQRVRSVPWAELLAPERKPAFDLSTAGAPLNTIDPKSDPRWAQYEELGRKLYEAGEVGVVIVAGGKGTRLGFERPKGLYPFAGATIFDWHIRQADAVGRRYGRDDLPVGIMTSAATHDDTLGYFAEQGHFGRNGNLHLFFSQGTLPSLDANKRAVLESRGELLENPDGHGGFLEAINRPEVREWFEERGVRYLMYVQVDNVGAMMDMPGFVGYLAQGFDAVTGIVKPAYLDEKLGRLMSVNDPEVPAGRRNIVIEYSDLTREQLERLGPAGEGGNISYYAWSLEGLGRFAGTPLPLHRQQKHVVGWQDGAHVPVTVTSAERHIHDLLAVSGFRSGAVMLPDRDVLFTPIKDNARVKPGAIDTPERALELIANRSRAWLASAGYAVTDGRLYVVRPEVATGPEALRDGIAAGRTLVERPRDGVIYVAWE